MTGFRHPDILAPHIHRETAHYSKANLWDPTPAWLSPDCSRCSARLSAGVPRLDDCIPVFAFPKFTAASEQLVRFAPGKTFPAFYQFCQRCFPNVHQQMHMIRHHHPSGQPVALSVKKAQRTFR